MKFLIILILLHICILINCQKNYFRNDYTQCLDDAWLIERDIKPVDRYHAELIIERNGWGSINITSHVARIILEEAMGYKTKFNFVGSSLETIGRMAKNVSHVNFEVWLSGKDKWITENITKNGVVDFSGNLGTVGSAGWYVASSMINESNPATFFDFWRTYRTPAASKYLTNFSSTTDHQSSWKPSWCTGGNDCGEWYGISNQTEPGIQEQIITNLRLNLGTVYLGGGYADKIKEKYNANSPIIFYTWYPDLLVSSLNVSRVFLKEYNEQCYLGNTKDQNGIGSVDCDYPSQNLAKISAHWLTQDKYYADASFFIQQFQFYRTSQEELLRTWAQLPARSSYAQTEEDYSNIACQWVKDNVNVWNTSARNVLVDPPRTVKFLDDTYSTIFLILAIVSLVVLAINLILLIVNWQHRVIKHASREFIMSMVFGALLICGSVIPGSSSEATDASCISDVFLFGFGYMTLFTSLTLKIYRIHQIFNSGGRSKQENSKRVKFGFLFTVLLGILILELLIQAVWLIVDQSRPMASPSTAVNEELVDIRTCSTTNPGIWYAVYGAPKLIIGIIGFVLAVKARDADENFNESHQQYIIFLVVGFVAVLSVALTFALSDQPELYIVVAGGAKLFCSLVAILLLLVPKFYRIYISKDYNMKSGSQRTPTGLPMGPKTDEEFMDAIDDSDDDSNSGEEGNKATENTRSL